MNAPAPQVDESERPRTATIKFTYPSGSRPLDGYTIKRGVGRGGFGEVYFATSDAGKEVALKLIRRNLDVELRGVTQCLNLKHPNLIALYDIKTDDMGDQWVVMEYVSGESLEDVIDRHPNGLPVAEALWWMRGLCAGVAYLHDHGIVHRDLKPGNIFSDEGTVKIGDYGLAKFISCSRRSGQTESVGTVHYMAPEIANGRYGREIDTYALGIILFEMLTGHVPFEGESVGEVLMKHLTAEPDLSVLQEPYRDIVKRALAKDPNERIKSVGELVAMLPDGAGQAAPVTPRPNVSPQPQPQDSPQPQPAAAAPSASAAAAEPPNRAGFARGDQAFSQPFQSAFGGAAYAEEPIAKAIRGGWTTLKRHWRGDGVPKMTGAQKFGLVLAVVFLARWLFRDTYNGNAPTVWMQLLVVYAIYYAVWMAMIRPNMLRMKGRLQTGGTSKLTVPPASSPAATPHSPDASQTAVWSPAAQQDAKSEPLTNASRRRRSRATWRELTNQQLAAKPFREKITELVGSMLLAAIFSALASGAVLALFNNQPTSDVFASYLWLATVGAIGSWAILVPAKFAEGKLEDHVPMRLSLMLLGALVGVVAWAIADELMLKSPGWHEPVQVDHSLLTHTVLGWPTVQNNTNPPIAVYIAYFAFLFVVLRWWRQAEYTRSSRLSLWSVFTSVFMAWLLHIFWWFPEPIGMVLAGVISVATQLASPWMTPSKRKAISESAA